jgi:NAD(P)-dependent dehydrogenase (short-subunit alcohol dehydrogenase family)
VDWDADWGKAVEARQMRLKDKVAIITGAKSGIGFATALRLSAEGATVVIADIRDARPELDEIVQRGGEALFVQADVSSERQATALIEKTVSTYRRLDVLVNNAGIELAKKVTDTSEAEWDHLMDVNLKGVFLCSKAAIRAMQHIGRGVIINVASGLGLVGGPESAAYCASKGGVVQLTKALAIDHADDGIRVNCVCPGPVATPLLEAIISASSNPEERRRRIVDSILLNRLGRPEEIANVILFLASDESSFITGASIVVDGGATAR